MVGRAVSGAGPHGGKDVAAFAIDRAVWTFGQAVENDMDEAEANLRKANKKATSERIAATRQAVLDKYLNIGQDAREEAPKGRFRDPASSGRRRRS